MVTGFSLQKSTLRRSAPVHNFSAWHQDGSFLGPTTRAMNVWVALTACGGAPGHGGQKYQSFVV